MALITCSVWHAISGWKRLSPHNSRRRSASAPQTGKVARLFHDFRYRTRGEAENRIGEQYELWADRASAATMAANQLRLWFSAIAYVLVNAMRRIALRDTQFADAAVATIRLKLLKLGARVCISARRVHFAIASSCPNQHEFEAAYLALKRTFSSA